QERRAARVATAWADAALHAGFVTCTKLTQLDARIQRARKVAHERTEVDAPGCAEVDDEAVVRIEVVDADNLHRQLVLPHESLRSNPCFGFARAITFVTSKMVGRREAGAHWKAADLLRHVG